ncbi:diguanylate cyclase (GGDEF) domain-containing protein [Saccharopolyspora antimicrobica]|uniref:Diguanylate cyclase (GGDEF) domain-containing protein n=1 Tax=Saccharopolyspora antimicrobica TaxID=455193 RepID=A0A1I5EY82_9PSEU|nr:diguanylate cyclase (GGDEF)-like protein [Saccharopolyspora antimicrobica]SFO16455.1 diguanylate cyclase (GGDEF) domain-containing protein [Saccharopolyspora antimicrobica]
MQHDDPLMAGHIPAQDREVRSLLDSGRFAEAEAAFEELIEAGANRVAEQWNRSAVLVHRASLAWRLKHIPIALELLAEGWTELDVDRPEGAAAAHTVSMLGYLLETIGHRGPALEMMALSVQLARDTDDSAALAHCLNREGNARIFRAATLPLEERGAQFALARDLFDESRMLTKPGQVKRSAMAGLARALVGVGDPDAAERVAQEALALARAADDWFTSSVANWVLAVVRRQQHRLEEARTLASRALDAAETIRDTMLMMQFSLDLAGICEALADPVGEAAALRRTVSASRLAVDALREGLGQALEQRRVAVQAQRMALAAREAALRDPLTGLTNRLGLERRAPLLLEQTAAAGRVPWLVLLDVDWFKDVNDRAGHPAGDVVLQEVAHLLRRECRADDLICRWAGDEFVVLLVGSSEDSREAGPVVAERIRAAVHNHDWRLVLGRITKPPTVSIGVAAGPANLEHLFAAADIALYRAKRAGRNRVEIDESPASDPSTTA